MRMLVINTGDCHGYTQQFHIMQLILSAHTQTHTSTVPHCLSSFFCCFYFQFCLSSLKYTACFTSTYILRALHTPNSTHNTQCSSLVLSHAIHKNHTHTSAHRTLSLTGTHTSTSIPSSAVNPACLPHLLLLHPFTVFGAQLCQGHAPHHDHVLLSKTSCRQKKDISNGDFFFRELQIFSRCFCTCGIHKVLLHKGLY